jgi:transposase-like protein
MPRRQIDEVESPQDWTTHNSRNGCSAKSVQGDLGQVPLQVPRDGSERRLAECRQSTFESVLVSKGQCCLAGLEQKIIKCGFGVSR